MLLLSSFLKTIQHNNPDNYYVNSLCSTGLDCLMTTPPPPKDKSTTLHILIFRLWHRIWKHERFWTEKCQVFLEFNMFLDIMAATLLCYQYQVKYEAMKQNVVLPPVPRVWVGACSYKRQYQVVCSTFTLTSCVWAARIDSSDGSNDGMRRVRLSHVRATSNLLRRFTM